MMKYSLILGMGGLLALASCGAGGGQDVAGQNAYIDSVVNARTAAMEISIKRNNDSLINAAARIKADSMFAAARGAKSAVPAVVPTSTPTVKTTTTTTGNTQHTSTAGPATTTDGRLNIDRGTTKNNDGRLNIDKNTTNTKDKKKDNDGRLKID